MKDLKERAIRGGFARIVAQAANFLFRVISLMVIARLLEPKDFGLVGMVTAFTGALSLFRDFGLSSATVQRVNVTDEQISTLFWINIVVGVVLAGLAACLAPVLGAFYHEPRLVGITVILATGFLFNAAGVQHSALLEREMRYTALAVINVICLIASTGIAIGMATAGYGYWALVAMTLTLPLGNTIGVWVATTWIPGAPRRRTGIRSMLRFGGTVTLNGLVVYVAYNLEKVLLGRFWGAEVIGLYGRAYQLVSIPTDNLNSSVGAVAFSALSRVQDNPIRLRNYFLKGYSLVLALTLPVTIACALLAPDLVFILLGPKWNEAAPIFRLLAPTILVFALINPLAWLLFATGMVGRSLKIALVIAPLVITGYVIGLPYGPKGVALGYSVAMTLWVIPDILWCVRGTPISFMDIVRTVRQPLLSGLVAGIVAGGVVFLWGQSLAPVARLALGGTVLCVVYLGMLLYVMGQKAFYFDLFGGLLKRRSPVEEKALASV